MRKLSTIRMTDSVRYQDSLSEFAPATRTSLLRRCTVEVVGFFTLLLWLRDTVLSSVLFVTFCTLVIHVHYCFYFIVIFHNILVKRRW
jgi:hypothetical protein